MVISDNIFSIYVLIFDNECKHRRLDIKTRFFFPLRRNDITGEPASVYIKKILLTENRRKFKTYQEHINAIKIKKY